MEETVTLPVEQEVADTRRLKQLKFFYPFTELASLLSYSFSSYTTFFMTNVYFLSVTFTAVLNLSSSIIGLVIIPVFAAFIDRIHFKKSKLWPWIAIGTVGSALCSILVMSLPAFGVKDAATLAPFVFVISLLRYFCDPMRDVPMAGVFPRLSKKPKDRQYFAMSQKVGRDVGKTIGGYIVPGMILAMTAFAGNEMGGYMYSAFIAYGVSMIGYLLLSLVGLRKSYVERIAMEEAQQAKAKEQKTSILAIIKIIFTNRPVLAMFLFFTLHKTYFFLYMSYATYVFEYVYQDFSMLGMFFSIFSFTAIIGVLAGPLWVKIFKESKRSFSAAMLAHVIVTAIIAVFFRSMPVGGFLVFFAISCFFMGMLENWILPMFAASADYGAWKTGQRSDNLVMSIYSLAFTPAFALPAIIASITLNSVDYTGFVASGAAPTQSIIAAISSLFSWTPLIIACLSLACLLFLFNLNDKRIKAIQDDVAEGKTKATSELKF